VTESLCRDFFALHCLFLYRSNYDSPLQNADTSHQILSHNDSIYNSLVCTLGEYCIGLLVHGFIVVTLFK